MLGLNTITLISSRVGSFIKRIVTDGLKMRLPFTSAEPLGENLVVNGDFNEDTTGWTGYVNASLSVNNNRLSITPTSASTSRATQGFTTEIGKQYIIIAEFDNPNSSTVLIGISPNADGGGATFNSSTSTSGVINVIFTATSTTSYASLSRGSVDTNTIYYDNISVEEYAQETPDTSGNDNNAILKTGKSLFIGGSGEAIEVNGFKMKEDEGTFVFWIKPNDTSGHNRYIIDVKETGDQGRFIIGTQFGAFRVYTTVDGGSTGGWTILGEYKHSQWQRVIVTIDSSKNCNLYMDGVLVGSVTTDEKMQIANGTYATIGNNHAGAGSGQGIKSSLSDFQIYDKVWTANDVAYDYVNPQGLVTDNVSSDIHLRNLKAWWHLSEGSGSIVHDSAPLIGGELIANGDFATDSDWAFGMYPYEGVDIGDGRAYFMGDGSAFTNIIQTDIFTHDMVYKIVADVTVISGEVKLQQWGINESVGVITQSGVYTFDYTADLSGIGNSTFTIARRHSGQAFEFYVNSISVKEVYNVDGKSYYDHDGDQQLNDLVFGGEWDTAVKRIPQLGMMNWSKGSNVLTYSNDLQASTWSSAYVVFDHGHEAPDGTMTAWKLTRDGAQGFGAVYDQTVAPNIGVTRSIWAKTVSGTGTVHLTSHNGNSNSLFTVTNDWQRFSVASGSSVAGNFYAVDFRGSSTLSEVIVWGAQEEVNVGDSLSAFRKTNGTAVTDATLISCATDPQKDILSNAVRVKGGALNLDGTGYGEVEHSADFDFGTGDFSVSAWVKFSHIAQGSSYNVIYTNGGQVDAAGTFGIMSLNPNRIRVLVDTSHCSSTTLFSQGEWVHIVATRNSGTISLYINGNKTPEDTNTNSNSVTSFQNPRIGFDGNVSRLYNDLIDDVKVYDEALTPDEVEQNYNATKSAHTN